MITSTKITRAFTPLILLIVIGYQISVGNTWTTSVFAYLFFVETHVFLDPAMERNRVDWTKWTPIPLMLAVLFVWHINFGSGWMVLVIFWLFMREYWRNMIPIPPEMWGPNETN